MRHDWITDRLEALDRTKSGLANVLGVDPARVSEIIAGRRNVKVTEIPALARYLEMDAGKVLLALTGESQPAGQTVGGFITLSVTGVVQAGHWAEATELPPDEWESVAVPRPDSHATHFGLRVRGSSMNLEYPEGTILVCVPFLHYAYPIDSGDHVIVHRRDATGLVEATVKELRRDGQGRWWLWPKSDDPEHQSPIALPRTPDDAEDHAGNDDIQVVAVVVADYRPRRPAGAGGSAGAAGPG